MIRAIILVMLVAAVVVGVLVLVGDAGHASLVWLGWRADMTAAAAILVSLAASLIAAVVWRTVLWILAAPRRAEHARIEIRRRQAVEALSRGFLAATAGDGAEARRLAKRAADLAPDAPGLVRCLAAQAAEAAEGCGGHPRRLHGHDGFPGDATGRPQRPNATGRESGRYGCRPASRPGGLWRSS